MPRRVPEGGAAGGPASASAVARRRPRPAGSPSALWLLVLSLSCISHVRATCGFNLDMYDTYGDGWNGAVWSVVGTGVSGTMNSATEHLGVQVVVPEGACYEFYVNSGTWPAEIEWNFAGTIGYAEQSVTFCAFCSSGCPSGTYITSAGACMLCGEGKYSVGLDNIACTACGGTTSGAGLADHDSYGDCDLCESGKYQSGNTCVFCEPGTYSVGSGNTACGTLPDMDHELDFRGCTGAVVDTYDAGIVATPGSGAACSAAGMQFGGGADDYVDVTPWEFGGSMSVEALVQYTSLGATGTVFDFGSTLDEFDTSSGAHDSVVLASNGTMSGVSVEVLQGGASDQYSAGGFALGGWTRVVVTVAGSGISIYQDGVLVGQRSDAHQPLFATRYKHRIGQSAFGNIEDGGTRAFHGTIAYVRFWHGVSLSGREVQALYSASLVSSPDHEFDFRSCSAGVPIPDTYVPSIQAVPVGLGCHPYGAVFDDPSDLVAVTPWEFGGTMSVEAYVRYDLAGSADQYIFNFGDEPDPSNRVSLGAAPQTNSVSWSVHQESAASTLDSAGSFPPQQWTHVVATVEGTQMRVYQNGALQGSFSSGWEPLLGTRSGHYFGSGPFYGAIAYLRFWHGAALDATAVSALFAKRRAERPSHEFDFRQCQGSVADTYDASLVAMPYGASCSPSGMTFDGVDDWADITPWFYGGKITVEILALYDSYTNYARMFSFGDALTVDDNLWMSCWASLDTVQFTSASGASSFSHNMGKWALGSWTHVVGTVDGATTSTYVNGALAGTSGSGFEPAYTTRAFHVLGKGDGTRAFLAGTISYLRFWHGAAFSADEAASLYAASRADVMASPDHMFDFRGCDGLVQDAFDTIVATPMGGAYCTFEGISMDGVDDYVNLGSWEFGGAMSVEALVRYESFGSLSPVFDFGNDSGNQRVVLASSPDGTSTMRWSVHDGATSFLETSSFKTNDWTHVVVSVAGSTLSLYNNGEFMGEITNGGSPLKTERQHHYLGRPTWDGHAWFHGTLAYIKFWHGAAFTADEAAAMSASVSYSEAPTSIPTTAHPTVSPSVPPTRSPTAQPRGGPTALPVHPPTPSPSAVPTASPTEAPFPAPTVSPTPRPSVQPTGTPTVVPSPGPTTAFVGVLEIEAAIQVAVEGMEAADYGEPELHVLRTAIADQSVAVFPEDVRIVNVTDVVAEDEGTARRLQTSEWAVEVDFVIAIMLETPAEAAAPFALVQNVVAELAAAVTSGTLASSIETEAEEAQLPSLSIVTVPELSFVEGESEVVIMPVPTTTPTPVPTVSPTTARPTAVPTPVPTTAAPTIQPYRKQTRPPYTLPEGEGSSTRSPTPQPTPTPPPLLPGNLLPVTVAGAMMTVTALISHFTWMMRLNLTDVLLLVTFLGMYFALLEVMG